MKKLLLILLLIASSAQAAVNLCVQNTLCSDRQIKWATLYSGSGYNNVHCLFPMRHDIVLANGSVTSSAVRAALFANGYNSSTAILPCNGFTTENTPGGMIYISVVGLYATTDNLMIIQVRSSGNSGSSTTTNTFTAAFTVKNLTEYNP